jgi:superfamily I DNA and/or RNA helicase
LLKKGFSLAEKSLWQIITQQSFKEFFHTQEGKRNVTLSHRFAEQIRLAWLFSLERQQPILRTSALQLSQWGEILQKNIQEQQAWSQAIVLQKAREQTYKDLIFNRLNNLLTYRELKHQVSKKKFVFPLRKLFQHHADDIFRLMPCWLASPETVSALFQMAQLFDCVIFDEASQCFAERGIPALLRGKQVVIVGDSQQLPPLDLYRFRWEEEYDENEETIVALEVNSLLDLGEQYLPTWTLTGHYRSQSLDLIDFSNQAFYKGKLRLIPHFQSFKNQTPAIHYHKVNGYWEKNTNPVEAIAVVDLLVQLLATGEESIGIITFNLQQQNLILDSIEERNIALPATVFVKNLENVQGDERNVIIFSVAYSPTLSGKMNRQFGLLSWERGENRLNVAVTRAKKAVHLVTSIFPHQLHTEELQNNGVRYLQAYLQYALDVSSQKYKPTLPPPTTQRPTWFLKQQLLQEHPEKEALQPLLPFADLYHTDQTLWFTDDDLYYNSLSVKDFHAYLPMQLHKKGWQFRQFWSREWWLREQVV